jgi:phenylacetic acid degradation operon negative regulatory protein
MTEPIRPQDLVVTVLGTYVRPRRQTVWSGGLVVLLGELGFSEGAARVALTRLVRRGLVERVREGRLVHYRMTPRAQRLLDDGDRRIFAFGRPRDCVETWTVLWHQIPEDRRLERHRLARRLRFLGFGSVQDSLWVSPHDHAAEVAELLADLDVSEFAALFAGRADGVSGLPGLVRRAWDLTGLEGRYLSFCTEFERLLPDDRRAALDNRESFAARTRLVHLFRGFPLLDPELPDDLAPLSHARSRAVCLFETLYAGLAAPAQRHFDLATQRVSPQVVPTKRVLSNP